MKRLVSFLLCLCMVLTTVTPAFAAEDDAEAMKSALLVVKNRIDIPTEYSQFEYSSGETNGQVTWNFFWTNPKGGDSISVRADHAGRIVRYQVYSGNPDKNIPPQMTKEEAIDSAKKLLSKTLPEIADKLVLERAEVYRYNDRYGITFVCQEHGVPVTDQTVLVELDYRTGVCFVISSQIDYDAEIKAPGTLVGNDTIFSRWDEMAGLTLEYTVNGGKGELWYNVTGDIRPIHAETGEIIPEDVVWEKAETEDSVTSGDGGGASNETFRDQLTPEEEEKNQELAGLISKEKADSIVRSYTALALGASDSLYGTYLYRDTSAYGEDKRSYWRLEYSGPVTKGENPNRAYACVDAKTGVLLSFRAYGKNTDDPGRVGEITAKNNAKAILKAAAAEIANKTDDGVRTNPGKETVSAEYRFRFGRVENDIPVSNHQITVSVSSSSGKVTEYTRTWKENVTFEDPSKVISTEEACGILHTYQDPKLEYYTQTVYLYDVDSDAETVDWYYSGIPTKKKISLAYLGPENVRRIDAIDKSVDAYGGVKESDPKVYSDIKGHFAEREIQILLDIGILPEGEKFEPNRKVTQIDLLYFILAAQPQYITFNADGSVNVNELYRIAIERGIVTEAERNAQKLVTRAEAARMIVRCTEFAKIAKNPNAFKSDYRDAASIPSADLGYVVVAKELGIMQGSGGMFRPNYVMTRGEAICMIFKYLTVTG